MGDMLPTEPLEEIDAILPPFGGGGGNGEDTDCALEEDLPERGGGTNDAPGPATPGTAQVAGVAMLTGATEGALARCGFSLTFRGKSFQPSLAFLFK